MKKTIYFIFIIILPGFVDINQAYELPVASGLVLWLDASNMDSLISADGTLHHGDRIVRWEDTLTAYNLSSDDFEQTDPDHQPIWFKHTSSSPAGSAVLFDGKSTYMHSGSLYIDDEMTVFIVAQNAIQLDTTGSIHRPLLAADNDPFRPGGTGYGIAYQFPGVDNLVVSLGNDAVEQKLVAEGINLEDWKLNILIIRREGNTLSEIWRRTSYELENVLMGNEETLTRTAGLYTGYDLGANPTSAARFYKGFVAEVIIYNCTLTDTEMQQVSDYLCDKYHLLPRVEDPFEALLYLPFEDSWNNYGTVIPEKGQVVIYNNIEPGFSAGVHGQCLDLTEATMSASAGCVLYGTAGSSDTLLEQELNGLKSLTVCGWFNTDDDTVHLKAYAGFLGRLGQLMIRSYDDDGHLVLGINNQWTAVDNAVTFDESNEWVFWAVTYDGAETSNNVKWYKGYENGSLSLLATHSLNAGTLVSVSDELVVANLLTSGAYSYAGLLDELRIFGSKTDSSGALSFSNIQAVYEHGKEPYCGSIPPYPITDINGDCRVDFKDLAELSRNWQLEIN